nr:substrate-binding domain-containing protein [Streptomyces sp. SID4917]
MLAAPASADPIPATDFRQLVGVGSDTTQDIGNALGLAITDPNNNPSSRLIASYDATGSTPIKTRALNCVITRPNGSSAGVDALRNNTGCIDFARSSRGPVDVTTNRLTWIPFAKDAVTIAVRSDSALRDGVGFTTAQLTDIYHCVPSALTRTYSTPSGPVLITLKPLLPHAGSGTRTFFLEKIGVTEAQVGTCVNATVQPNDGTALTDSGHIAPYSIAQYIAQTAGVTTDRHGAAVLTPVNGVQPRIAGRLNMAFPYAHDVYNVVPTAKLTGGATPDADLIGAFQTSPLAPAKVCLQTARIEQHGFGPIGAACGNTSIKGER